jgi:hypothetical protein
MFSLFLKELYMSFQPIEEKNAERDLIKDFAIKTKRTVVKLQEDNDDGGTDGIVEYNGEKISVEARRKGFPNHRGWSSSAFKDGWESRCLVNDGGIFLNESTIKNYKNKSFIFIVEIKGFKPKHCIIDPPMVDELLKQPHRAMKSTNSGVMQSVKTVPLSWFKEY